MKEILVKKWRQLVPDESQRRFIMHNQSVWRKRRIATREVLFNVDYISFNHVKFSYLLNVLADQHEAVIKGFSDSSLRWQRVERALLQSYGVSKVIVAVLTADMARRADELWQTLRPNLKSKQDIFDLVVEDIWIGVDVYDTYLRREQRATVDITDPRLDLYLRLGISQVLFWNDYFAHHEVRAAVISHDAYLPAMAFRKAANHAGVAVYSPDVLVPSVREGEFAAAAAWPAYRQLFRQLPLAEQTRGLAAARLQLWRRFGGENVNMPNIDTSAWHGRQQPRVLRMSTKPKVLICTHEFSDAPNVFGGMIFLDFLEWLEYLGEFSKTAGYDWYIKMHPDFWPLTKQTVREFIRQYPAFTLLDAAVSHHQLINEGITAVLTCYGTVGHEYPAQGVPAIHAGYNRHSAYDFALHARTKVEYEHLLRSIPDLKGVRNQQDVYEFYYMNHYEELVEPPLAGWWRGWQESVAGEDKLTSAVLGKFVDQWTEGKHRELIAYLDEALALRIDHPAEVTLHRQRVDTAARVNVR